MGHQGAEDQVAVAFDRYVPALGQAGDIHHHLGLHKPEVDHGQQALASGDDLRVLPMRTQQVTGIGVLPGSFVSEWSCEHRIPPSEAMLDVASRSQQGLLIHREGCTRRCSPTGSAGGSQPGSRPSTAAGVSLAIFARYSCGTPMSSKAASSMRSPSGCGGPANWPRSEPRTMFSPRKAVIHSASSPGCCSQKIGETHEHATYSMVAPLEIRSRCTSRLSLHSDQFACVTMNRVTPASTAASWRARISARDRWPVASATSFSATISQIVWASRVRERPSSSKTVTPSPGSWRLRRPNWG